MKFLCYINSYYIINFNKHATMSTAEMIQLQIEQVENKLDMLTRRKEQCNNKLDNYEEKKASLEQKLRLFKDAEKKDDQHITRINMLIKPSFGIAQECKHGLRCTAYYCTFFHPDGKYDPESFGSYYDETFEIKKTPEFKSVKYQAPKRELQGTKVEGAKVESTKVEPPKRELQGTKVESAKVEDAKVEAPKRELQGAKVESAKVEDAKVEDAKVEDAEVEDAEVDDSKVKNAELGDAEFAFMMEVMSAGRIECWADAAE